MNSDQFARSEKARSTLKASDWVVCAQQCTHDPITDLTCE